MNDYTLKNFRVFDAEGATFKIAPLTILTGCNSSGKSSVTKSLMLLNDIFYRWRRDYRNGGRCYLEDYSLRLNKGMHNLGKFASIVNADSSDKEFTIEYTRITCFNDRNVKVQITFTFEDANRTENGRIKSIVLFNQDDKQICEFNLNSGVASCDFSMLKKDFFEFANDAILYKKLKAYIDKNEKAKATNTKGLTEKEQKEANDLIQALGEFKYFLFDKIIPTQYDRDHLKDLVDSCKYYEESIFYSLFYVDVLKRLEGYKKVDVPRIMTKYVRSTVSRFRYQEFVYPFQKRVNMIIDDYCQSDFVTFQDYFVHYEDLFLKKLGFEFMSDNNEERWSFLSKIQSSLAYKYAGVNKMIGCLKDTYPVIENDVEELWNHEEYKFIFIYHYMRWISTSNPSKDIQDDGYNEWFDTDIFDSMILYFCNLVEDVLIDAPSFICDITFVDANRANVQRLYNYRDQTSSFNLLIQDFLSQKSSSRNKQPIEAFIPVILKAQMVNVVKTDEDGSPVFDKPISMGIKKLSLDYEIDYSDRYVIGSFIKKWIEKFGIADDISFVPAAAGAGISVVLIKNGVERNLADFGFGVTQLVSMLLQIEISILSNQKEAEIEQVLDDNKTVNKQKYKFNESYLAIEEPETHLHPKYQSLLAELFYDAYSQYNVCFIIETHSEYLIRNLQLMVAKKVVEPSKVMIHYLNNPVVELRDAEEKNQPQVKYIEIESDGSLSDSFGSGFYDEATKSFQQLMNI